MIIKGGAVGGGGLASHLQKAENESVELIAAEGVFSRDIDGVVAELRARGVGVLLERLQFRFLTTRRARVTSTREREADLMHRHSYRARVGLNYFALEIPVWYRNP